MKALSDESSGGLLRILDEMARHRIQLRLLGSEVDSWDAWFISCATSVLPVKTQEAWEAEVGRISALPKDPVDRPTYEHLRSFLQQRSSMALAVEERVGGRRATASTSARAVLSSQSSGSKSARVMATRGAWPPCPSCKGSHYLGHCDDYKNADLETRKMLVTKKQLCFNCLRSGHRVGTCPSRSTCQEAECQESHHTTLHPGDRKRHGSSMGSEPGDKRQRVEETHVESSQAISDTTL